MTKPPETPDSRTTPGSAQAMMDEFLNSHNVGTAAEWSDNIVSSFENVGAGAIFNNPGHLGAGINAIGDIAQNMAAVASGLGNDVKMDTDAVTTIADNIAILNGDMKDRFNELSKAVDKLHGSWEGKAAETCIGKFKDIDSAYSESRYTVINNVVLFLKQQIGEGYEETEKANVSLADYFK